MNRPPETQVATVIIETSCINNLWRAVYHGVTGAGDTEEDAIDDLWDTIWRKLEGYDD